MRICLVASPGGHLTQLLYLEQGLLDHYRFYITYLDARALTLARTHFLENPWKKPYTILLMLPRILLILLREKPDLIISTGAEIAIPVFVLARILRIRTIFIESLARIETRSTTGIILYPLASLFLVQWPSLLS